MPTVPLVTKVQQQGQMIEELRAAQDALFKRVVELQAIVMGDPAAEPVEADMVYRAEQVLKQHYEH